MKKYIIPIIIILLATTLFIYRKDNSKTDTFIKEETVQTSTATLSIDFGEDTLKTFDLSIADSDTAFSVLKDTLEKENINLEIQQYDFGVFVKKIGEFESSAKKSWIYYVNGESGQVAADQNFIKNGDKVEWKYESPK